MGEVVPMVWNHWSVAPQNPVTELLPSLEERVVFSSLRTLRLEPILVNVLPAKLKKGGEGKVLVDDAIHIAACLRCPISNAVLPGIPLTHALTSVIVSLVFDWTMPVLVPARIGMLAHWSTVQPAPACVSVLLPVLVAVPDQ